MFHANGAVGIKQKTSYSEEETVMRKFVVISMAFLLIVGWFVIADRPTQANSLATSVALFNELSESSIALQPIDSQEDNTAEQGNSIAELEEVLSEPTIQQIWGPDRSTFTMQEPAEYPVFNSITNNHEIPGEDERNFVRLSDIRSRDNITDQLNVLDNQEVYVLAFVHNNAYAGSQLVAEDVFIEFDVNRWSEQTADGEHILDVFGFLRSSNTNPLYIWDNATLIANQPFRISYVEGSAQWAGRGVDVPQVYELGNPTVSGGVQLHDIQACNSYEGWVSFRVVVKYNAFDFNLQKSVRFNGETPQDWRRNAANVEIGDIIDFRLVYSQTGNEIRHNVTLISDLPTELEYIVGSARISNVNHPNHLLVTDFNPEADTETTNITTTGLNIGAYANNSNAFITFSARVTDSFTKDDGILRAESRVRITGEEDYIDYVYLLQNNMN